jgi:hypothetical protein
MKSRQLAEFPHAPWRARFDAAAELLTVQPTTVAGLIALMHYAVEFEVAEGLWPDYFVGTEGAGEAERIWFVWLLRHVADTLETLVVAS